MKRKEKLGKGSPSGGDKAQEVAQPKKAGAVAAWCEGEGPTVLRKTSEEWGGHLLCTGIPRGQEEKRWDTELESVLKWRGGKVLQDARQTRRGSAATFFP